MAAGSGDGDMDLDLTEALGGEDVDDLYSGTFSNNN